MVVIAGASIRAVCVAGTVIRALVEVVVVAPVLADSIALAAGEALVANSLQFVNYCLALIFMSFNPPKSRSRNGYRPENMSLLDDHI